MPLRVPDAAADLLLGGACVGCARPGRVLCLDCRAGLPDHAVQRWPTPTPPGLVPPFATGDYLDLLRAMILAHKERRLLTLQRPLGALLAVAVSQALEQVGVPVGESVVLIPAPSRRGAARQRGHDPTLRMCQAAQEALSRDGRDVLVAPLLRFRAGVIDQAGLDIAQRRSNLAGSMECAPGALRRLRGLRAAGHLVICDDVITTGATAREAQRALGAVGLPPVAIAAVAATRRRASISGVLLSSHPGTE